MRHIDSEHFILKFPYRLHCACFLTVKRRSPPATPLKPEDMKTLKPLIQPVAGHWDAIADQLEMRSYVSTIRHTDSNKTPAACLRDLLNRWLNQGQPTLEALCQALRDDPEIIGGAGVATKLEEKFQSRRGF